VVVDHALRVVEGQLAPAIVAASRPQTGRDLPAELASAERVACQNRLALMIVSAPVISLMMCKSDMGWSALAPKKRAAAPAAQALPAAGFRRKRVCCRTCRNSRESTATPTAPPATASTPAASPGCGWGLWVCGSAGLKHVERTLGSWVNPSAAERIARSDSADHCPAIMASVAIAIDTRSACCGSP
jgi:hypothetical protein